MDPQYCTVKDAAAFAGVSPQTIRKWIRDGRLPAAAPGGQKYFILRSDIEKIMTPTTQKKPTNIG